MQSAVVISLLLLSGLSSQQTINPAITTCSSQSTFFDTTQYKCDSCTPNTNQDNSGN